jgi:hypothetical protein
MHISISDLNKPVLLYIPSPDLGARTEMERKAYYIYLLVLKLPFFSQDLRYTDEKLFL